MRRSPTRRLPRVLAFAIALAAIGGCRQTLGLDTYSSRADGGCVTRFGSGSCAACVSSACCSEASACESSAVCNPYGACLSDCGGAPQCGSQCTIDHPVRGAAEAAALDACLAANCAGPCNLVCGGFATKVAEPDTSDACQACMSASGSACMLASACAVSEDCEAYVHCRRSCVTGDCLGACGPHEADLTLYNPAHSQLETDCFDACKTRDQWYCAGHMHWPTVTTATRRFTVSLTDPVSGNSPVVGALVQMCGPGDPSCPKPVDQQTTDPNGVVVLTDNIRAVNGVDYGLNGFLEVSSPSVYPTLIYWGFPLSAPDGRLGEPIPTFSPGEFSLLTATAGAQLDAQRGHVAAVVVDCLGYQAVGVTLSLTAVDGTTMSPFYVASTTLSPTAKGTDATGTAFFLNVPPGDATVQATPLGFTRAASTVGVMVRAATLTEVGMQPTP